MAKKKRRHKKPSTSTPLSAPIPPSQPVEAPKARKFLWIASGLVMAVLAITVIYLFKSNPSPPNSTATDDSRILQKLSHIDFARMEPQVAEKIRRLRNDVEANPKSADAWGKLAMNLDVQRKSVGFSEAAMR